MLGMLANPCRGVDSACCDWEGAEGFTSAKATTHNHTQQHAMTRNNTKASSKQAASYMQESNTQAGQN